MRSFSKVWAGWNVSENVIDLDVWRFDGTERPRKEGTYIKCLLDRFGLIIAEARKGEGRVVGTKGVFNEQ